MGSALVDQVWKRHQPGHRRRLYTIPVVFWLMISQRLQAPGSLAQAVTRLRPSRLGRLGVTAKTISRRTGGFCRARLRIPLAVFQELTNHLITELQGRLAGDGQRPVYILDGSSLTLDHHSELVRKYPPSTNQYGTSHWPIVKIVVLHEARSGLAVTPAWGPMYGPHAVSEQGLAEQALEGLPAGAILLGDRNFGVFQMAYRVQQRGAGMIWRLTAARSQKLRAGPLKPGMDERVIWTPSRWDRDAQGNFPTDAAVPGRLIVTQWAGWREPIYLFTNLESPAADIVKLYGLRWNIETDLRSIKQTVRLCQISVKSIDMLEKELWVALAAYNLVRAVMFSAALQSRLHPRELSFTHVYYLIEVYLPDLLANPRSRRSRRELNQLIAEAATCRLPRRKKRRSYPREIWGKAHSFPSRKSDVVSQSK